MASKGLNSSGKLHHDTLKFWVARWGEANGWAWEFEGRVDQQRMIKPFRSDVCLTRTKNKDGYYNKAYVEVQNDITTVWKDKMRQQYEDLHYIIIDMDKYPLIEDSYKSLCLQLDNEVDLEVKGPQYDSGSYYVHCELCGKRIKKTNESKHLRYQCKKRHLKEEVK